MIPNSFLSALLGLALCLSPGCARALRPAETAAPPAPAVTAPARDRQAVIEELVTNYGSYGPEADARAAALLGELQAADPGAAASWTRIMDLWRTCDAGVPLNYDVLPDGLPDSDELAIVVLGFQLAPDGGMRPELTQRLNVALRSAEKYPNAFLVCTGGPTAAENAAVTEAGNMAAWLTERGVARERILAEGRSLTTAQNAVYSFDLLEQQAPQVKRLALVSSDYHIATGTLLFGAEAILRAARTGTEPIEIVSNAAWDAPDRVLSPMFQAGALIELSGDADTAFAIYTDTYDVHALPPLDR